MSATMDTRPRISVINDNPDFLELMSAILEDEAHYDVTLFNGDHMRIEELRESRPDLVIVDLVLGSASGWDVIALSRADPELGGVPILVCSADVTQLRERADELAAVGNLHVLRKPFEIDELVGIVNELVGPAAEPGPAAATMPRARQQPAVGA
jgi:CheY-like chemotaxis protein